MFYTDPKFPTLLIRKRAPCSLTLVKATPHWINAIQREAEKCADDNQDQAHCSKCVITHSSSFLLHVTCERDVLRLTRRLKYHHKQLVFTSLSAPDSSV